MSSKAERLAIAAAVAPELRRQHAEGRRLRPVKLVDEDGNVVRVATLAEVQDGIMKRAGVEFEVAEGARPKRVACRACRSFFDASQRKTGSVPVVCSECRLCVDCGAPLSDRGRRRRWSAGGGRRCLRCARSQRHTGGPPPYGYRVEAGALVAVEAEQAVICEARALRAAGLSLRAVATELDRRGLRARTGRRFGPKQIARMVAT